MARPAHNATASALRWAPVVAWFAQVLAVAPTIEAALAPRSAAVQHTGSVAAWTWWAAGLVALLVPSSVSLTAIRVAAPAGVLATVWAGLAGGPSAGELVAAVTVTSLATMLAFNAELGRRFVQGSAYGDESRFPLRPPGALLAGPLPLLYLSAVVPLLAGPTLFAARQWIVGALLTIVAVAWTVVLVPRFHRLSRRWLVFVPAGVVVHDHTVLAETSMFPRNAVDSCALAPAGTEAADLTGNAYGMAVEFRLRTDGDKVVLAASKEHPHGRALHVRSFFVSPTLPGAALAEARRRGIRDFA